MNASLKELIIIHINYRDVFNAPVNLYDLQRWVDVTEDIQLIGEINELISEGLIETDGKLNYCVAGRSELFIHQASKKRLSQRSLRNHARIMNYLSWIPFIRFVGVSGSIAAENPTITRSGFRKGSVDIDIFIITSDNSLWLIFCFVKMLSTLLTVLFKERYLLCFNYAMDNTFLEIHNRNIFTATELFNLKVFFNKDDTFGKLIKVNSWAEKYYPSLGKTRHECRSNPINSLLKVVSSVLIYPLNFSAFVIFQFLLCLKRRSFRPLLSIKRRFSYSQHNNLKRICAPFGGYQDLISDAFESKLRQNFNPYFRPQLMEFLFPMQHFEGKDAMIIDKTDLTASMKELFIKYEMTSPN